MGRQRPMFPRTNGEMSFSCNDSYDSRDSYSEKSSSRPRFARRTGRFHVFPLRLVARHAHHETQIIFLNHFLEMLLFAWLPVVLQRPKSGHVSPPFVLLMVVSIMRTTLRLPLFVTRFQEESRGATISIMSLLSRTVTVSVAHYRYHIM